MKFWLQLVTASVTMTSVWMAGNGDQRFNWVGLANQGLWLLVIFTSGTWGLLPLTGGMLFVYGRNIWRNYVVVRPH